MRNKVETDDAIYTSKKYENVYSSHNSSFWENRKGFKAGPKRV